MAPGGRLAIYTGSAIVDGHDLFREQTEKLLAEAGHVYEYEEMDPDVFGEELAHPPYDQADRIAVVALILRKY